MRQALDALESYGPPASVRVPDSNEVISPRELDVLRLLAEGASNQLIAERLSISIWTVKSHVTSLLTKLGVASRTQAAARARELRIL